MSETTQYLRPAQVCKRLNISRTTLYRWHANNPNFPRLSRLSGKCTVWGAAAIDAFVKEQAVLNEAEMLASSRKAVLEGSDWFTAAKVADLASLGGTIPSAQINKWKRQQQLFAIHHSGVEYFPGYGLDPEDGWRPRKTLKAILEVFGDAKDGWGLAYWFLSANSFLGGRRPQDALASDPEQVIAAARAEMKAIAHG